MYVIDFISSQNEELKITFFVCSQNEQSNIQKTPKQKEIIALEKMSDWKYCNVEVSIKDKKNKKNRKKVLTNEKIKFKIRT